MREKHAWLHARHPRRPSPTEGRREWHTRSQARTKQHTSEKTHEQTNDRPTTQLLLKEMNQLKFQKAPH